MKICNKCGVEKELSEFTNSKKSPDGLAYWCKPCCANLQREHRKNPEIRRLRVASCAAWRLANPDGKNIHRRKKDYGLEDSQYKTLLESQKNSCAICKDPFIKTPHVDHDHLTNKIRGLLCGPCNLGLGQFKDSPTVLLAAFSYLKETG